MSQTIRTAVYAIPVPDGLTQRVLAACDQGKKRNSASALRFVPAVAAAAACVAVMLTAILTGKPSAPPPVDTSAVVPPLTTTATTGKNTTVSATTTSGTAAPSVTPTTSGSTATPSTTVTEPSRPVDSLLKAIPGRFEAMTVQELEAHYGRIWRPARLPADLVPSEEHLRRGIYHKDETIIAQMPTTWSFLLKQGAIRDAAIIYDLNDSYWVSTENPNRNLAVSVSTAPYPEHLLGDISRFDSTVEVAGVTVAVHRYDDSPYTDTWCHSALITVDKVAYYISAWEFTETEFLDILSSLLA